MNDTVPSHAMQPIPVGSVSPAHTDHILDPT